MADTLEIFGNEYTNVAGFKATDSNNATKTYIRPDGTKSITQNGTGIDVAAYATADVAVPLGTKSITQNGTYNASSDSLAGYSSVSVNVSGSGRIGTATAEGTSSSQLTISFNVSGEPSMFAVQATNWGTSSYYSTNASTRRIISVVYDGTTTNSQCAYYSSSKTYVRNYDTVTFSYSSGTLTLTSASSSVGYFYGGALDRATYTLTYIY